MNPQEDPPYRSAELLRVFLLGEIPPEHAREYVQAVADHADAELKRYQELRDSIDWADDDTDFFYGRAALEYGLRVEVMKGGVGTVAGQGHRRSRREINVASR